MLSHLSAFAQQIAIIDQSGNHSYGQLQQAALHISRLLQQNSDLSQQRIAFLLPPSFEFVATMLAIWEVGAVAVPLCLTHPAPALQYTLQDTGARFVVSNAALAPVLQDVGISILRIEDLLAAANPNPDAVPIENNAHRALMLYTSGTTNKPKGVVWTRDNIRHQQETLATAWHWRTDDRILNVLPLHHVHGLVNALLCPLWVGAAVEFMPKFDSQRVWERLASGQISVFMAVPTIYYKLIQYWEGLAEKDKIHYSSAIQHLRLMVSGSAALPVSVLEKWRQISGHTLLERYGMTEIGMALSNPYQGERRAGCVGLPLPNTLVRLVNDDGSTIASENVAGEIQVKGDGVFLEYWQRPQATAEAFSSDGWFKTGDVAVLENGYYRILGRMSSDIIKSGGYKLSALEIEEVARQITGVSDCAVVALPDEEWGEIVGLAYEGNIAPESLLAQLRSLLPAYKTPRRIRQMLALPRNAMGKVMKGDIDC